MVTKLLSWSQGKKTYITVAIGLAIGIAQAPPFNIHVPSYVNWALGFLGLGAARMAITAQTQVTATAMAGLISDILSQVTTTVQTDGPSVTTVTQPVVQPVQAPVIKTLDTTPSGVLTPAQEVSETKLLNEGRFNK